MFGYVFRHEVWLFRLNRSWWGSLAALVLLTVLAAWTGQSYSAARGAGVVALETDSLMLLDTLKAQLRAYERAPADAPPAAANPGALGYSVLTTPVGLPRLPLHAMAVGQSDSLANYYRLTAHAAYSFMNDTNIANPHNLLAGSFDVAFVIVFVLPVFIIALSFDLLSREKEHGVLALALAQGVSLPRYTLAKFAARACIVLLVIAAVAFAGFLLAGFDVGGPGALRDAALWLVIVTGYAAFWFALGLFVNSLDLPSETNGIMMANIWLLAVVVIPAMVNVIAITWFPAPSRVTLTTELREAASEAERRAAEAREQFFFDHPDLADSTQEPGVFFREVMASEAAIAESLQPLLDEFDNQADRRRRVVGTLQYLSPAILTQEALSILAGTDDARYADFRYQVQEFHRRYQAFFTSRLLDDELLTARELERIPRFEFVEADDRSRRIIAPIFAMLLLGAALVASALRRYRSYSVLQSP